MTPTWKRSCVQGLFGATIVITQTGSLSWRVVGDVKGGWFRSFVVFLGTVNSGAYGDNAIDVEVTCYAGDDPAELVGVHRGAACSGADTPELASASTPNTGLAIGETAWFLGAGSHTYQTGYFSVDVRGNFGTGSKCDAYFRINRLRWGDVIVWSAGDKGILTSNVKYG